MTVKRLIETVWSRLKSRREPVVSVVIPVYNDPEGIQRTLQSLLEQTYPTTRHEILVVDNGSNDDTREVIREFTTANDHIELLVEDDIQGSYAARNRGVKTAEGEVIAFLDADVTVAPDHLERGVKELDARSADYLACNVELTSQGRRTVAEQYNERRGFPVERYLREEHYGPTCGLFVRASVFEEVGLFDERLVSGGDGEFGARVHRAGKSQAFSPSLTVHHPTRSSIRELLQKNVRIGRGLQQRRRYYPERYESPSVVFTPKIVVPLRPSVFRNWCRGWEELSTKDKVAFYLVEYLRKLGKSYGMLSHELMARSTQLYRKSRR